MNKSAYARFNNGLAYLSSFLESPFLLLLRLYIGIAFILAGFEKLQDLQQVAGFFTKLNIPFPTLNAYLVSIVEFVGSISLVLGLGTRLSALLLMFVMIVALLTAHYDKFMQIFVDPQSVITMVPFIFLVGCLILFIYGAGKLSLDYLFTKE